MIQRPTESELWQAGIDVVREHKIGVSDGFDPEAAEDLGFFGGVEMPRRYGESAEGDPVDPQIVSDLGSKAFDAEKEPDPAQEQNT